MRRPAPEPTVAATTLEQEATMNHIATVQEIYGAFGRGDVPAILDRLAQDVAWEAYGGSGDDEGVLWLLRRNGRAGVAEFFASLDAFEFRRFEPLSFLSGADQVAVPVRVELAVKASGFVIEDEEIHLWTFDDAGLVSAFRHVVDTAKHIDAARSLVAAASS
jgi:ketosteroid isomerase-like protein